MRLRACGCRSKSTYATEKSSWPRLEQGGVRRREGRREEGGGRREPAGHITKAACRWLGRGQTGVEETSAKRDRDAWMRARQTSRDAWMRARQTSCGG